ncbi:CBASS cGAMP synthase [Brevundimonas sp. BR2-1]|uniref:CBASS cGAMP synthase n=1 Tax=Brevundimonas sp. BR2-1 TaxID=3031123 RepID=UPI0030B5CCAA
MGVAAGLFYSTNDPQKSLDYRIRPSDEQYRSQEERWNDLREVLLADLSEKSGCPMYSWLQGSYKFGTQIRPASAGQEFDIDLGVYFRWSGQPTDGAHTPVDLKDLIQGSLETYAEDPGNDAEGVSEPKPRCSRIHFADDFHIDIPGYHLDSDRDARSLATSDDTWEDSDPKAIYKWWKDTFDGAARPRVRRSVRYLKMWGALAFPDGDRPSSIMLTILAGDAYNAINPDEFTGDDELLAGLAAEISRRLHRDSSVANPVNKAENLNRLSAESFASVKERLDTFVATAQRAVACTSKAASAEVWAEIFQHFFEIPDEEDEDVLMEKANALPAVSFNPQVAVTAKSKDGQRFWKGENEIGPIPKGCELEFALTNVLELPPGAEVSWTIRNSGNEAEKENDLGHSGGTGYSRKETSAYRGRHFVDVAVKVNGSLIGRRRIPVEVTGMGWPTQRARARPTYGKFRSKRR